MTLETQKMTVTFWLVILVLLTLANVITLNYHSLTVTNNSNDDDGDYDNDTILNIVLQTGIIINNSNKNIRNKKQQVKQQQKQHLFPTMNDFAAMYGKESKIFGLETCQKFQRNVPAEHRIVGPAGLYNTGTNLLTKLLQEHCYIEQQSQQQPQQQHESAKSRMFGTLPWDKHAPLEFREKGNYKPPNLINILYPSLNSTFTYNNTFPVVLVKDPYFWMDSMTRHRYAAIWNASNYSKINLYQEYDEYENKYRNKSKTTMFSTPIVPNTTEKKKLQIYKSDKGRTSFLTLSPQDIKERGKKLQVWFTNEIGAENITYDRFVEYNDLVQLWNSFYSDYFHATFPRLMVRYEDLLLYSQEIIPTICTCVGGTLKNTFNGNKPLIEKNPAKDPEKYGKTSNLLESLMQYGNSTLRIKEFTDGDLIFAKNRLNKEMMNTFHYNFP